MSLQTAWSIKQDLFWTKAFIGRDENRQTCDLWQEKVLGRQGFGFCGHKLWDCNFIFNFIKGKCSIYYDDDLCCNLCCAHFPNLIHPPIPDIVILFNIQGSFVWLFSLSFTSLQSKIPPNLTPFSFCCLPPFSIFHFSFSLALSLCFIGCSSSQLVEEG